MHVDVLIYVYIVLSIDEMNPYKSVSPFFVIPFASQCMQIAKISEQVLGFFFYRQSIYDLLYLSIKESKLIHKCKKKRYGFCLYNNERSGLECMEEAHICLLFYVRLHLVMSLLFVRWLIKGLIFMYNPTLLLVLRVHAFLICDQISTFGSCFSNVVDDDVMYVTGLYNNKSSQLLIYSYFSNLIPRTDLIKYESRF